MKKTLLGLVWLLAFLCGSAQAAEPQPIKIGGIFSTFAMPDWMIPAQDAAKMAVEEWNEKGGLHGRKAEMLIRDDRGDPAAAVQVGQDLISREHVAALLGVSFTNVSLAIADLADREKIPYVAAWCWKDTCTERVNKTVFTLDLRTSDIVGPLADWAARQPITRWGAIVPAEEFSRASFKAFEVELKKRKPEAEIVALQTYNYGTNPFSQIVSILRQKKVEGLFNAVTAQELTKYLRAARLAKFDVPTVHNFLPSDGLAPLKEEAPVGWYALGYPAEDIKTPAYQAFSAKFEKRFGRAPGYAAMQSYVAATFVLNALDKAGSDDPAAITAAMRGLKVETPVGPVAMDAKTQRADLGYWYGTVDVKDGKPMLRDYQSTAEKEPQ